jgi:hypothetical protein
VYNGFPKFLGRLLYVIYSHCWELMNSVSSHGSSSLPFVMKVMVCHFVSNSHEVMTALIVALPLIVVVEISLQLHQDFGNVVLKISESEDLFSHCCAATGISSYSATRLQCGSTSQSSQECHYILVQFFSMHCFSLSCDVHNFVYCHVQTNG